jgi:hypothetical protein
MIRILSHPVKIKYLNIQNRFEQLFKTLPD